MDHRKEIVGEFSKLLQVLEKMELGRQALEPLPAMSASLTDLDRKIQQAFEQFDHQFHAYVQQVNLLGQLIELQRRLTRYRGKPKTAELIFGFLKEQLDFDGGFLYFHPLPGASSDVLLTDGTLQKQQVRDILLKEDGLRTMEHIVGGRDLGVLLSAGHQFNPQKPPWQGFNAESIILFPIRSRDQLLGFGALLKHATPFPLDHLSFINLIAGILGLFLFQNYSLPLLRSKAPKRQPENPFEGMRYADYFENGPMFIYTLDESGIILHVNQTVTTRFGGETHLAGIGENFYSLFDETERQRVKEMLKQVTENQQRFLECTIFPKQAARARWQLYATRLQLRDNFTVFTVFAVDVSDRFLENRLQQFHEAMAKAGGLSDVVLREVDRMLNAVVPGLSLLKSQLGQQPQLAHQVEMLQQPVADVQKLMQVINNYALSDIEKPGPLDLNQQLQQLSAGLAPDARLQLDQQITAFESFPGRVKQLLEFLLRESQGTEVEGPVTIETRRVSHGPAGVAVNGNQDWVEIVFSKGEAVAHHPGQPFLNGGLAGSGLREVERFSAYRMIRDLGGEILVGEGKGRDIHCFLPVVPQTKQLTGQILVVDDEPSIRSALEDILRQNGYNVATASNGREGLELFASSTGQFDLVIMDMMMPEMDGKTTFHEMRKLKKDQKIVMISGYSRRKDLQELIAGGSAGFIPKPFQVNQVVEKVEKVLKNSK